MSETRKRYVLRLIGRITVFLACLILCFISPQEFEILEGNDFFRKFSIFHLLWFIWVGDMVLQIIPVKNKVALGSQKLFANRFRPIREKINSQSLKNYILSTTNAAYKVMLLRILLIGAIGVLYYLHVINRIGLLMISVLFYVCDLICVLIWCPFRLIMKISAVRPAVFLTGII